MRYVNLTVLLLCFFALPTMSQEKAEENHKYYLMIAQPNDAAWKGVIEAGGDMAEPAAKALEAMGGKLHSYYIAVVEPKNYGVVFIPKLVQHCQIGLYANSSGAYEGY